MYKTGTKKFLHYYLLQITKDFCMFAIWLNKIFRIANFKQLKKFMLIICYALFYSLPTNWKFEGYERIFQFFLTLTSQRTINYWRLLIFFSSRFDVCERRHHQCHNSFCITCKRANFCLQKHAFKKVTKGTHCYNEK